MLEPTDSATVPKREKRARPDLRDTARDRVQPGTGYLWLFAAMVAVAYGLAAWAAAAPLAFADDALVNVGNVLAPLVLVAAFIERAVEVVLTPWRGDESDVIEQNIKAHREAGKVEAAESQRVLLRRHKNGTRRRAFLIAVSLGLMAALVGFRAVSMLVENPPTAGIFVSFDVLITGLVLGGGADGIHKAMEAFTDYMDMISESAKKRASA